MGMGGNDDNDESDDEKGSSLLTGGSNVMERPVMYKTRGLCPRD